MLSNLSTRNLFAKCKKSIENIIEFTVGKYIVDIVVFFYYDR